MAAPVSVAAALPVSRSTTCTRPTSPSTPHSASLFAEPVRGRGNANPARGKPPTQPRNLPCILRTEIVSVLERSLHFGPGTSVTSPLRWKDRKSGFRAFLLLLTLDTCP